jgi:amino acid/peptide:H+ symporter
LTRNNTHGVYCITLITTTAVFSYSVLYSSLSLYLTEKVEFPILESNNIVGIFIAFNFLLHLFAGYIGGKLISNKALLGISLLSQFVGSFIIACLDLAFLKIGLCFFLIGCGFGTTCLNCLLSDQFERGNQEKREKAFFINYAALNLGCFFGCLISGYFYSLNEFKTLFQISCWFNLISSILFFFFQKNIRQTTRHTLSPFYGRNKWGVGFIAIIFICLILGFNYEEYTNISVISLCFISLLYIGLKAKTTEKKYKHKIFSFIIFVLAAIIFWTLYFIGPMGFVFFLKNNVQLRMMGQLISPQWFMNLDTILIIIGAPLLASTFQYLSRRNINISIAMKFSFALLMIAFSWFILLVGIQHANNLGLTGIGWIITYYILQAIGELLIAPVGYAMVGKVAPESLQGVMMGTWLMLCGVSSVLSHHVSNAMTMTSNDPLVTNINYLLVFRNIGVYALFAGVLLLAFSRKITSYIEHDTHVEKCKLNVDLELINE